MLFRSTYDGTKKVTEFAADGVYFFSEDESIITGGLTASKLYYDRSTRYVNLFSPSGSPIIISHKEAGAYGIGLELMSFDVSGSYSGFRGIDVNVAVRLRPNLYVGSGKVISTGSDGLVYFEFKGTSIYHRAPSHFYLNVTMWRDFTVHGATTLKDLNATGTKNAIVPTRDGIRGEIGRASCRERV